MRLQIGEYQCSTRTCRIAIGVEDRSRCFCGAAHRDVRLGYQLPARSATEAPVVLSLRWCSSFIPVAVIKISQTKASQGRKGFGWLTTPAPLYRQVQIQVHFCKEGKARTQEQPRHIQAKSEEERVLACCACQLPFFTGLGAA